MKKYLFIVIALTLITVLGLILVYFNKSVSSNKIIINVKTDYHAKGNGVSDDTSKIQKALTEAPSGATIIIPKGTYNIGGKRKYRVVTEYGPSFSVFKINKPLTILMEDAVLKTNNSEKVGVFWIKHTSNVTIKGGFLYGDSIPTDGGPTSRVGVLIQNSKSCKIEDLSIRNFSQGINIDDSQKTILLNCLTEYNFRSGIISYHSSKSTINSCTILNSGDGDLSLYGGGRNNKAINNIIIEDRPNNNGQQGITVESEKNSIIGNNTVTGFYYGIDIKNGSEWCKIEHNHSFNNKFNIVIREGDPKNLHTISNNITISNNNVEDDRTYDGVAELLVNVGAGHKIYGNIITKNKMVYKSNILSSNPISSKEVFDNVFLD